MRFFAHDGQTVHGPSPVEELTRLPGFDGTTLVCPAGSENSNDWKPALAYPPFRVVLLAPRLKLNAPPAPTAPCPRCAHANPKKARFCNECGARMDGTLPPPPPAPAPDVPALLLPPDPAPFDLPATAEPSARFEPLIPEPAPDPYVSELPPEPVAVEAAPAPNPGASAFRKTLIAAFVGAAAASGGLGWWLLKPHRPHVPAGAELTVTPPAAPAADAAPAPVSPPPAAPPPVPAAPAESPKPVAAEPPPAPKPAKKKKAPKRPAFKPIRKAKVQAPPVEEKPAEPGAPSTDDGVLLPGIPRRVPPKAATEPAKDAELAPPGKEDSKEPAAAPPAGPAEDPAAGQVREQFEFCSQLLSQGAYADHFDTCLCASARQAAPYGGKSDVYAAKMKKAGAKNAPAAPAPGAVALDGASATITAGGTTEHWSLEDGLWCRAK